MQSAEHEPGLRCESLPANIPFMIVAGLSMSLTANAVDYALHHNRYDRSSHDFSAVSDPFSDIWKPAVRLSTAELT